MKLNKLTVAGLALVTAFAINCKKPDAAAVPGDLKSAANEYVAMTEKTAAALEAATDGKAAAKILIDVETTSNAMQAKFPQLKEFDKTPELADLHKRFGEAGLAFLSALAKADDKFKSVPEFAEAMKRIMKTDGK
ncbi:MAG: hypothetical protein KF713_00780 [Turneriella sp.]|nr:hypothetical protein [Turneriella sp.]